MKTTLVIYLLLSPVIIPATGKYTKLISKTAAKKSTSQSMASSAWANRGQIATRSITSLISTLGLIGALEAVRIAREAATPSETSTLDEMLNSLLAMSATPNSTLADYDGIFVALGGLIIFIIVSVILMRCGKCCKKPESDMKEEINSVNTIIAPEITIANPPSAPVGPCLVNKTQGSVCDRPVSTESTEITIK